VRVLLVSKPPFATTKMCSPPDEVLVESLFLFSVAIPSLVFFFLRSSARYLPQDLESLAAFKIRQDTLVPKTFRLAECLVLCASFLVGVVFPVLPWCLVPCLFFFWGARCGRTVFPHHPYLSTENHLLYWPRRSIVLGPFPSSWRRIFSLRVPRPPIFLVTD